MKETTITVRTSEQYADDLAKYAGTKSAGAIRACEGFINIRKYSLYELKRIFTKQELTAIIDGQNSTMLVPDYQANKGVFLAHLEDFEMLESGITRHGANWEKVKTKIKNLTASQVYFLQDEIDLFWSKGGDLNIFIDDYL